MRIIVLDTIAGIIYINQLEIQDKQSGRRWTGKKSVDKEETVEIKIDSLNGKKVEFQNWTICGM